MPPTRATTTAPWRSVDLPHDWSIELDPTTDGTNSETGFFQGGLGWYRKTFTLPRSAARKSVSLEFDGIYMDSVVFLNGKQVASHPYGYTGFAVDLAGRAHRRPHAQRRRRRGPQQAPQQPLVLGQRHLPQRPPRGHRPRARGAPRDARDDARRREHVQAGLRQRARAHGRRGTRPPTPASCTRVRTPAGARVATAGPATPADGSATTDLRLSHPHLWSTDDPYLYTLDHRGPRGPQRPSTAPRRPSACAGSTSTPRRASPSTGAR